jgi:dephospho-CoA kinase
MNRYSPSEKRRSSKALPCGFAPVLGVTGGIGSGKTAVAAAFSKRGAAVIVADAEGHRLLDDGPIQRAIVERFGPGVLAERHDGKGPSARIDRRKLGAIVFADSGALEDLESILHPRMRQEFVAVIDAARRPGAGVPFIVLDAAVLLEARWDDLCDVVVFVDAPPDQRQQRVARERGWDLGTLRARERAQWPDDQKRACADYVIKNDGDCDHLSDEVDRLIAHLEDSMRSTDEQSKSLAL